MKYENHYVKGKHQNVFSQYTVFVTLILQMPKTSRVCKISCKIFSKGIKFFKIPRLPFLIYVKLYLIKYYLTIKIVLKKFK